ncbi:MAG: hypothetical protein M3N26_09180 [Pseudomonadota bacterium]|nr:hypothetical protein [Pseudomonadota bacterium]
MTTNVGSRANLRFYLRPPLVTIAEKDTAASIIAARADVSAAFKAFLEAPGGPRPLTVSVKFAGGSGYSESQRRSILSDLRVFVESLPRAQPQLHTIALNAEIGQQEQGRDDARRAIETANGAGLRLVTIDGIVRKDADRLISLPGLLEYLTSDLVNDVLAFAHERGITVRPINHVDADTVARETWISLTTARAMGLNLGKYGLFPLTLEQCDIVIGRIQSWIKGWGAAPVFYADQGIVSEGNVYVGPKLITGIKAWLDVLRKHGVSLCLIDTVDKAAGRKILKSDLDPEGLLEIAQIRELSEYGCKAGINILWAGGITPQQAYQFGQLGVFGIYVTTAASVAAPVTDEYRDDPGLAVEKRPTYAGVRLVKTLLEAGFLGQRVNVADLDLARREAERVQKLLPVAWQAHWKSSQRGRKAPVGGRA